MKALAWALALMVFLVFFGVYSFRLGIEPAFMHDDYEYTYPSFSLAERGNFGSPLLGTGFNVANRTYHFAVAPSRSRWPTPFTLPCSPPPAPSSWSGGTRFWACSSSSSSSRTTSAW